MAIINSILDNDLYAFTTSNALTKTMPNDYGQMKLIFRENVEFTREMVDMIEQEIKALSLLKIKNKELEFFKKSCDYIDAPYFTFIKGFEFKESNVEVVFSSSEKTLWIFIDGLLHEIVLYEVPIMAIISEVYFRENKLITSKEDVIKTTEKKLKFLEKTGVNFSEFGTRRRESFDSQDFVISVLKNSKILNGTSNVYFAYKYSLTPIGTFPHFWVMAHGAKYGYELANNLAFENWINTYDGRLGIALVDTFTSDICFEQMSIKQAKLFDGVRHDSGDPVKFIKSVINFYESNKIDPSTKTVVFSDSLNETSMMNIKTFMNDNSSYKLPKIAFGIGTWLTNNFGHKHLNMVIKLNEIYDNNSDYSYKCVKLSDDISKATGDKEEIEMCIKILGL